MIRKVQLMGGVGGCAIDGDTPMDSRVIHEVIGTTVGFQELD